jgi:hypothetical protein
MAGTGHVGGKLMITDPADWQLIRPGDVVVDPLVLRYGEIFLGGRGGAGERAEAKWRAIANDVGGLLLFFDQVVLRERIPIFNYGDTFDMGLNLSERVLARVNEYEEILVEVDVQYLPYAQAKSVAIEQVKELFDEKRALPDDLAREIIRHLSVFEYDWNPNVDALGLETEKERRLAAFLVGGLVFGAYAQQTGAPHVRRSVKGLTDRVARELGVAKDELVSAKLNAAQLGTGALSPIDASVDLRKGAKRLWGWVFPGLINRGSRKLLTRATVAQSEYIDIAKALRNRWTQI